jgi:ubiquinone/menaquinone biosynthesis C-methylase UbiE
MPKTGPFEEHTEQYEQWFEEHQNAYQSELTALRRLLPKPGFGVEIGVGSARFAAPLGIRVGIDPAERMLEHARKRGIDVVRGVAEALPFEDETFDTALIVRRSVSSTTCSEPSPRPSEFSHRMAPS